MITISEIAKEANVSRTLVSRVINNKPGVSSEKRKLITDVIQKHNYKPNPLARSLITQKTQTVGVVMDSLCDPFFFELINGFQDEAESRNYNVIFCSCRESAELKLKYVDFFIRGRADGVIAYGSYMRDQEILKKIVDMSPCFVLIEGSAPDLKINNILLDNYGGAYKATEHLIGLGYKKIMHFTSNMNYKVSLDRFNGFVNAMRDHMISISPDDIITADFSAESGYNQMERIIESNNIPDAIFFGADQTAFGAIKAMNEHGLKSPDDIAIIGFDDDRPDNYDMVYPKLTTLRQPMYQMGVESMRMLIDVINDSTKSPIVKTFEPELVIRDTCR